MREKRENETKRREEKYNIVTAWQVISKGSVKNSQKMGVMSSCMKF